jgi:Domain of unknown function (DUF1918)
MRAHRGDLIVIESERVAQSGRRGVIEEVLREKAATPPRPLGRRPHERLLPIGRSGKDRGAETDA